LDLKSAGSGVRTQPESPIVTPRESGASVSELYINWVPFESPSPSSWSAADQAAIWLTCRFHGFCCPARGSGES